MNREAQAKVVPLPNLINALRSGFDATARHIVLILFPVGLDLFLWLGPHFKPRTLFQAFLDQALTLPGVNAPEWSSFLQTNQAFWEFMAENFNLASSLRTYPIGIPSLMASRFPANTPLSAPPVVDITTPGGLAGAWVLFALLGILLGSLFFSLVARAAVPDGTNLSIPRYGQQALQVIFLAVLWIIFLLILIIPALVLVSLLAIVSPGMAQIAILLYSIFVIWTVVPLIFSPHGIFILKMNAFHSLLTSARLVRFLLPGTGIFFLAVIILSQGLDLLWQIPSDTSWMSLVGIAGHAFITTALLAASFVYYRDGIRWVQEKIQRKLVTQAHESQKIGM
jgi:hypothetical protein